jgi:hypothetical protein
MHSWRGIRDRSHGTRTVTDGGDCAFLETSLTSPTATTPGAEVSKGNGACSLKTSELCGRISADEGE